MPETKRLYVTPTEFVEFQAPPNPKSLTQLVATREASVDFFSVISNLYLIDPDPILRRAGKDITALRELKSDAHVAAVSESRKAGVLSLRWELGGAGGERFRAIERAFARLDVERIMREILEAPLFGYQPLEVMWEAREGLLLPRDVVGKPPEWFRFGTQGELLFRTKRNSAGEPVPRMKFLVARRGATFANPYGEKALSKCFWPVTFQKGGIKFWASFTEKYGMPLAIAKLEPGASDEDMERSLDMLSNMVQDAVAAFRGEVELDVITPPQHGASVDIYERFINFNNAEISKAILGQTLTTELTGRTGSFAASRTHMEVRRDIVTMDRRLVESVMNTLITWIWELNFSPRDIASAPRFTFVEEGSIDRALAERDRILHSAGVRFTKGYFMRAYGLEEGDFELGEEGR